MKKKFFKKEENRRTFFVSVWAGLYFLGVQMIGKAAEWTFEILGVKDRWPLIFSYAVMVIAIMWFINKHFKKYLE